jgi:hypothetical protein
VIEGGQYPRQPLTPVGWCPQNFKLSVSLRGLLATVSPPVEAYQYSEVLAAFLLGRFVLPVNCISGCVETKLRHLELIILHWHYDSHTSRTSYDALNIVKWADRKNTLILVLADSGIYGNTQEKCVWTLRLN